MATYKDFLGNPVSVLGKSDQAVVLGFWGNSYYQLQTNDDNLDHVPKRVRENWHKAHILKADDLEGWRELREDFEKFGFGA